MSDPQPAANPERPNVNQRWALAMAIGFCGMAALAGWIWKDLDHRIAAGKAREAATGKPVGPDLLQSPREAAAAAAKAAKAAKARDAGK